MSKHAVVHVDIPANSPAASSKFYADLFGWKSIVEPSVDYHMFQSEPEPGGGSTNILLCGQSSPSVPPGKADY